MIDRCATTLPYRWFSPEWRTWPAKRTVWQTGKNIKPFNLLKTLIWRSEGDQLSINCRLLTISLHFFFFLQLPSVFLGRKVWAGHLSVRLCLKSAPWKSQCNLTRVAVVTQIPDPTRRCPFPFHPSQQRDSSSLSVIHCTKQQRRALCAAFLCLSSQSHVI